MKDKDFFPKDEYFDFNPKNGNLKINDKFT